MPRAGLSPDVVVGLAVDVVDDDGWDDLTLAAVAARAGVAVPSLYKHVAGLTALRRAVASVCVDELVERMTRARADLVGAAALLAMAHATRDLAREHPGRYQAIQGDWGGRHSKGPESDSHFGTATTPSGPPAPRGTAAATDLHARAARAVDLMAAAVAELDVPAERRIDAVRAIRAAVHGFVLLELAGGFGMPQDVDTSFDYLITHLTSGLHHPTAELEG